MENPKTSSSLLPVNEIQESFAGGMRDRDHASQIDPNQYAYGKNIEIRDAGLAKTRRGTSIQSATLNTVPQEVAYYEPTPGNGMIIQVNTGVVYKWTVASGVWTQVKTATLNNISARCSISILNGILYLYAGANDHVWSWDGVAADFTDEGDSDAEPPLGDLSTVQAGRMVAAGVPATVAPSAITNARDYLFFSSVFDGHTFDRLNNTQRIPTDGSEPITAIAMYRLLQILCFTRNSCHIYDMTGSTVSGFSRITIDPKIGCSAPNSLVVVGEDAFFLSSDRHIRTIKRTINDIAYGVSNPVSFWVPNLMDRINVSYVHICAGVYYDNYYLLAAPLDTGTTNNGVIVFDLLHQVATPSGYVPVCVGEWTNIKPFKWVVTNFSNQRELYYVSATTGALYKMFDGTSDVTTLPDVDPEEETTIPSRILTRAPNWGTPRHDKTMHNGEIQFLNTVGTLVASYIKDDGTVYSLLTASVGSENDAFLPISLPFLLAGGGTLFNLPLSFYRQGRSRNWQLQLDHDGGQCQYKEITMSAFVEGAMTR